MISFVQISFLLTAILVGVSGQFCPNADPTLSNTYENCKVLSSNNYELYWTYVPANSEIRFAVRVRATGWVGLGISPNGGMKDSDMAIGWVNSGGMAVLNDHYAVERSRPPIDSTVGGRDGDWRLRDGRFDGTWTILEFDRNLDTGDAQRDRVLVEGNNRMVYAWSDNRPTSANNIMYHGTNRGSQGVAFFEDGRAGDEIAAAQSVNFTVDGITIPSASTTYWCSGYRLPQEIREQTRHMIYFAPLIPALSVPYVHHMILYECKGQDFSSLTAEQLKGDNCQSSLVAGCRGGPIVAAWAVGGQAYQFPDNVSFSFGGPGAAEYFVIETHYNNPSNVLNVMDYSGMQLRYVDQQRTFDAGVLEVGHQVTEDMVVPPRSTSFSIFGVCNETCTASNFPCEGITVFGNTFHTHLAGVALTLRHYRGGQEIMPVFDQELTYDFNFQDIRSIGPRKVMPGDALVLECVYQTINNTGALVGGLATTDEMCLSFLNYYPRTALDQCLSIATTSAFLDFISALNSTQQAIITESFQRNGQTNLRAVVSEFPWDAGSRMHLQTAYEFGGKFHYCSNQPNQTVCTEGSGAGPSASKSGVMTVLFSSIVFLALWLTQ
jgi:hypothetical protein